MIEEKDKIPLKQCNAILNADGEKYTDEQVLKMRDYLYKLAAIEVEHFKMMRNEGKLDVKLKKQ